jgi:hypothetical protein
MQRARWLLIGLLLLVGAGGAWWLATRAIEQRGVGSTPCPSPRETMLTAMVAIRDGSDSRLLGCCKAKPDEIKVLRAYVANARAAADFRAAFIKAYGDQAWAAFQDEEHHPEDANATLMLITEKELAEVRASKFDETDATASMQASGHTFRFVKVKGGWLVDASSFVPDGAEPAKNAEMLQSLAKMVRKHQKAIGRPGIKPEDIDVELGRAIAVEFGLSTNEPHRFDIDHLP